MAPDTVERFFVWQVGETAGFDSAWARLDRGGLAGRGRAVGQVPEPYWLSYVVETDESLATTLVRAESQVGDTVRRLDLRRERSQWTVDGTARADLDEALDCDIGYCPLTNTMPIVRERLHQGPGTTRLVMAFITVPTLDVVPSVQEYEHLGSTDHGARVRFRAGSFTSDLTIDEDGFVVDYPQLATRVTATPAR